MPAGYFIPAGWSSRKLAEKMDLIQTYLTQVRDSQAILCSSILSVCVEQEIFWSVVLISA